MAKQGSYQRPDGRWQVRETFPDGERRSFYGKTEREAIAKKKSALRDYEEGLTRGGERLTVNEFVKQWLADTASERVRPSTLIAYTSHYTTHIKPAMKGIRLRDLTPADVDRMLSRIVKAGASPTTANRVRATLRTALNYAVRQRWVTFNAAALSTARKQTQKRVQPLTIPQTRKLIEGTADLPIGPMVTVAIYTGLRQGELLALEWQDIDFDEETISVRQTLTWMKNPDGGTPRNIPQFTAPKTESSRRTFHIPQPAIVALRHQQSRIADLERMATVTRWKPIRGRDLVFPSATGGPQNSSNVTNSLVAALSALELPHQRFHDLRHLTAALLLAEGVDIFTVKEILGHSQISQTANTYGHLMQKLSKSAALQIGGALNESAPIINPDTIALGGTVDGVEVQE